MDGGSTDGRLAQELGMKSFAVVDILYLAGIASATGDTERAGRLAAAATVHLPVIAPHETNRPDFEEIVERVKAACDADTWERAAAEGMGMTLDEAADFALSSA